tara:strand:- start:443 stop:874 length:432 start_codon:yes stop_codon:yes gene_type:complete
LEQSLLDIKRGVAMKNKTIKESKTVTYTDDVHPVVEQMESEWPEMTKEFKRLQREQYELFLKKQHDYGPGNISVGTMLQTEEEIQLSLTGLWFRMNDKIQRLKNLLMSGRDNAVQGEPMEDAFLDVSNYGIMATIVKNGKWGK